MYGADHDTVFVGRSVAERSTFDDGWRHRVGTGGWCGPFFVAGTAAFGGSARTTLAARLHLDFGLRKVRRAEPTAYGSHHWAEGQTD